MSLEQQLRDDIETFMATHAINIRADVSGWGGRLSNSGPFTNVGVQTLDKVSLTAPSGFAEFEVEVPKQEHLVLKCGVPDVNLQLTQDNSKLPVYVIPYMGKKGLGVKLPAGQERVYAITTTINGCTLAISGTKQQPYVSHANVAELVEGQSKQTRMANHISELEQSFRQAEEEANQGEEGNVDLDKTYFNYWYSPPNQNNHAQLVNYVEVMQNNVRFQTMQGTAHYRENKLGHHVKYLVKVADRSKQDILESKEAINNSAVIGERRDGEWKFYFSSSHVVYFEILKQKKRTGKVLTSDVSRFNTLCVVAYGPLWPHFEAKLMPFFTANYNSPKFRGMK